MIFRNSKNKHTCQLMIRIDIKTTLAKYFFHRYKVRIQVKCHNKNMT
jgi:hypothetical protein